MCAWIYFININATWLCRFLWGLRFVIVGFIMCFVPNFPHPKCVMVDGYILLKKNRAMAGQLTYGKVMKNFILKLVSLNNSSYIQMETIAFIWLPYTLLVWYYYLSYSSSPTDYHKYNQYYDKWQIHLNDYYKRERNNNFQR